MKKVCFLIPRTYYLFNPNVEGAKDKVGGAQLQTYLLSTELAKDKNYDVHFCMADFGQKEFEIREDVKLWNAFNFNENILSRTRHLFKTLKKINADIYILRTADVGVAIAIFYIKFFLKKKILFMLAADAETTHKRLKDHAGFVTAGSMRSAYKKVDIITAQTQQQSDIFANDRRRKPDIILKNIYIKKEKEIEGKIKDTILWVGRLDKIKNPLIYLETAKKFPNENFIMIAPVVRDYIKYGNSIQEQAKKIKNLKLIDFVKPTEIHDYYLKAKIYILTSELEGFSNTMAEAMQAECPVLSYNVNPDNILHEHECGLCAGAVPEKLYEDFNTLNSDKGLREKYGKNGSNYIRSFHKKELIIEAFKDLF